MPEAQPAPAIDPIPTGTRGTTGKFHELRLSEPWRHKGEGTEVTAYWLERHTPELAGRASLVFECGAFRLGLDPTLPELRALAALLTALADERECTEQRALAERRLAEEGLM